MDKSLRTPAQQQLLTLIREARAEADLNQAEVAATLGKPQSYIAKIEGGERRLDVVEFILLMQAIGADPAVAIAEIAKAADN